MKFLFVTLDAGGNLYPELALAQRAHARGHTVRFLAGGSQRAAIEGSGFSFVPYATAPDLDSTVSDTAPVRDWVDDPATAFTALCDHIWFGPAALFAQDVLAELEREPVDGLVVDYFMPGAVAAGERALVPTVVLWHTTFGEWDAWNQGLPAFNVARATMGLAPLSNVYEQYRTAQRVLVLTSEGFDFSMEALPLPANVRHVGPQFPDDAPLNRRRTTGSNGPPLVLVSLSTGYQGQEDVLGRVVEALGTLPVRALVTTGRAVGFHDPIPHNVEVREWIPHAEVLLDATLVVTHAGMGTVMASAAYGVPMICVPMGRDQHGNAARVEHLQAGRVVSDDASSAALADAIEAALEDPRLAAGARRLADVIERDVRNDLAVRELEAIASDGS